MEEKRIWGIHTAAERLFLEKGRIAIRWREMGNLSLLPPDREAFKKKYRETYPDAKPQAVANSAGMLYRFVHEVRPGDYILFPSRFDREIHFGEIAGDYTFLPTEGKYAQARSVKWLKQLPRTSFSQGALYEVGSVMSFFSVKNYADEYVSSFCGKQKCTETVSEDADAAAENADETVESTKDFILKVLSRNLKGHGLEPFVADLLQAMGYHTDLSPHGGDNGIDITAYKDELPPRILVQVKSGNSEIQESTIQSLRGAMHEGDYGLFVTLSDYTKNARRYLENTPIIRGFSGADLAELILRYYDNLSECYREMIPLRKVYVPVVRED